MAHLVSAKGSDVLAWRAAGEFAATYRQVILNRMEFCRSDQSAALLNDAVHSLEELEAANRSFIGRCEALTEETAECREPARLHELTTSVFRLLYGHYTVHRSAPAFYQLSTLFLHAVSRSVTRHACDRLGISVRQLPEVALVALGPAGRQEFSPFCPLQFMLVHGRSDTAADGLALRFAELVHEGFTGCGLRLDEAVTARNRQWCGSLPEWEQRLKGVLERGNPREIIEALRLADQTLLDGSAETGSTFRQSALALLSASPAARSNLVSRVTALSNGIGIMGGLRFERGGAHRGLFGLLEHGLQPLSASVSALALLKHAEGATTPRRIRDLLWRRELNVDMAENLLQAWHTLNEFSLTRQCEVQSDWHATSPLYLDVDPMDAAEQESLRESLEAVGTIQRHIGLNFSGTGD